MQYEIDKLNQKSQESQKLLSLRSSIKILQKIQLDITSQQFNENSELNQELQITLDSLNKNNENKSQQLSKFQIELEQLQYENDITEQNQEIEQLNNQIEQLTELFEQRSNEIDDATQFRGELALKNNEKNLLIQRLQNKLESQKQKLFELQKQHQIQGQVKEEICKSQFEQMKRQMESEIELLETQNKTILYQLQMKSREEWKKQYSKTF
ncbi:unnamed protein product [Paramecium primaurelia]|uniref:Uncharacterized protein n=1 Tax=Paramecium primaurelia TaxID=5886 RepID=A0A8S1MSX7_PARPR|nr:unnamed protein product [Paramecium primaurelia]